MGFLYSLLFEIGVVYFKIATVISCLLDGVNNCTSKTVGPVKRSTAQSIEDDEIADVFFSVSFVFYVQPMFDLEIDAQYDAWAWPPLVWDVHRRVEYYPHET